MSRLLEDVRYPAQAEQCSAAAWSGRAERCRWCDQPARSGQAWCGQLCEAAFRRNHWWDQAREAATVRDGGCCVRCGLGPRVLTEAKALLRLLIPMTMLDDRRAWHSAEWGELVQACEIEVNHIVPRVGAGYHAGCHHHLDVLETLCHRCHVQVTNAQAAARREAA